MAALESGSVIGIPCDMAHGPFSTEKLISFETKDGPVSGFVSVEELREDAGVWHVRATVVSTEGDTATVRVRGDFFNTNGLATIQMRAAA